MYGEPAPPAVDPYSDAYNVPPPPAAPAGDTRDREALPVRGRSHSRSRSPGFRSPFGPGGGRRRSPAGPKRPAHAPIAPNPSHVLGVFGLSIRTTERDLEDEFNRFGRVEKVTIVYDQRSDRSRGFGFITMSAVEEASRCIKELNGIDLNGRRIRVDYSVTDRPHAPTPGEYMGHRRRRDNKDSYYGGRDGGGRDGGRDSYRESYRDRDSYSRRGGPSGYDRERDYERDKDFGRDREYERDRDHYGRDNRDWRDRRSPAPARGGGGRYSPDYRRRRSYSRSPPRGGSPTKGRDYEAAAGVPPAAGAEASRW